MDNDARKAGYEPKEGSAEKSKVGGKIQGYKAKDGSIWVPDRKAGHYHRYYDDTYGNYDNIDPDGVIRHKGQSTRPFYKQIMIKNLNMMTIMENKGIII